MSKLAFMRRGNLTFTLRTSNEDDDDDEEDDIIASHNSTNFVLPLHSKSMIYPFSLLRLPLHVITATDFPTLGVATYVVKHLPPKDIIIAKLKTSLT